MHDHSRWWEVKPLHNSIGIFSKHLKKSHSFLYFVKVKLKAKLACHPASGLLPVGIIERCGLAIGPATVELLPYLLPY